MMPNQEVISEMVMSMDMAKIIRESSGDALSSINGVEEIILDLTKVLRSKVLSFTKEQIEFNFSGMRLFDGIPEEDEEDILKIKITGEEESRVAAVLAYPEPVRHVLAILFGGKSASVSDFSQGPLRPSEANLFKLVADQLVSGLVEAVDILGAYGVPGSPTVADKKEFKQFTNNQVLVALSYEVGFEEDLKAFDFLVPLEIFDIINLSKADESQEQSELSEEDIWTAQLIGQVENLAIPMGVELAAFDLSLSKLGEMQIGETLSVNATHGGLRILDDTGVTAFLANIEIHNRKFGLRVTESRKNEGA